MESLISNGDVEQTVWGRDMQSARQRFGNINIQKNSSKPPFFAEKGIVVNTNHHPNGFKHVCESLFVPKLSRKTRNPNPLINSLNGSRIEIKKGPRDSKQD